MEVPDPDLVVADLVVADLVAADPVAGAEMAAGTEGAGRTLLKTLLPPDAETLQQSKRSGPRQQQAALGPEMFLTFSRPD